MRKKVRLRKRVRKDVPVVSVSVAHGGPSPLLLSARRGTDVQSLIRAEETEAEMDALNEEALWKHHFRADRFDAPPLDDASESGDGGDGRGGGQEKGRREEAGGYALRLGSFREEGRYGGGEEGVEGGGDGRGKASRAGAYASPKYALPVDEVYYASYSYYAYSISESGE